MDLKNIYLLCLTLWNNKHDDESDNKRCPEYIVSSH